MSVRLSDREPSSSAGKRSSSEPYDRDTELHAAKRHFNEQRAALLHPFTTPGGIINRINGDPNGRVVALDIDQCSAFGEDTNDIMQIISRMTNGLDPSHLNSKHLFQVTKHLINPRMIDAIKEIRRRSNAPHIVFYTSKRAIVDFFNPLRRASNPANPLKQRGILINDNLMKFKEGNLTEGWGYLYNQLPQTQRAPWLNPNSPYCEQLHRVGILTWVASVMLGLPMSASVYITRAPKDMEIICRDLGINDISKSILFDDKAISHADTLGLTLEQARMTPVQAYNPRTATKDMLKDLYADLMQYFPIKEEFAEQFESLMRMASTPIKEKWPEWNLAVTDAPRQWRSQAEYGADGLGERWDTSGVLYGIPEGAVGPVVDPGFGGNQYSRQFGRGRIIALTENGRNYGNSRAWPNQRAHDNPRTLSGPPSLDMSPSVRKRTPIHGHVM